MSPAKRKFNLDLFKKWFDSVGIASGGIIAAFVLNGVLNTNEKLAVQDERMNGFERKLASFEKTTDEIRMDMKSSSGKMESMQQAIIKIQAVLPKQDQFDVK